MKSLKSLKSLTSMKSLWVTGPIVVLFIMFLLGSADSAPGQVAVPGQRATPATRVAYVSAQRLLTESAFGKAELARVQAAQQQRTNELRARQQAIEELRAQVLKGGGDAATTARLQGQEQQQRLDFERAAAQAQSEMQTLQRQMQADLQARVRPIVQALAEARNIDIILNAETTIVWAAPGLDLTSAVIERLNAP